MKLKGKVVVRKDPRAPNWLVDVALCDPEFTAMEIYDSIHIELRKMDKHMRKKMGGYWISSVTPQIEREMIHAIKRAMMLKYEVVELDYAEELIKIELKTMLTPF